MSKSSRGRFFPKFLLFLLIVGILIALYLYFKPFELPFEIPEIPFLTTEEETTEEFTTPKETAEIETTPEETESTTPGGSGGASSGDSLCNHSIVIDKAVEPTCTAPGLTEGKHCSICGEIFVAQKIVSARHTFGEWITVREATATEEGLKERTCVRCGEKETQIIVIVSVGLEFTLKEDGESYSVTGIGTCRDTYIVIPTEHNGLPVTSIGDFAFSHCSALSVLIPDSVTGIGNSAFSYCKALTSIVVDNDNTVYQSINGNLYSKGGKTLIVYAIGKNATSFTIPDSVTSIGDDAFRDCDTLTSITIPDSVTSIGNNAFANCDALESVTMGNGVTDIGKYAFWNCVTLTSVTIGDSVTSIGEGVFESCSRLTSVTIPDSVTSIGDYAFLCCDGLTSITIPDSVTGIGEGAFYYCFSLKSITFDGTVEEWGAMTKGSSWNYNIPATEVICSDGVVALN